MSVPRSPRWAITLGLLFIGAYVFVQLTRLPLFMFDISEGQMVKYEYVPNKKDKDSKLLIWLNDTISKPYRISYKAEQEKIDEQLNKLRYVKIWTSEEKEIKQLESNGQEVFTYTWFCRLPLIRTPLNSINNYYLGQV